MNRLQNIKREPWIERARKKLLAKELTGPAMTNTEKPFLLNLSLPCPNKYLIKRFKKINSKVISKFPKVINQKTTLLLGNFMPKEAQEREKSVKNYVYDVHFFVSLHWKIGL